MFFAVSKLFWLVAEPINLLVLLGLLGIALSLTRFAPPGRGLMVIALLVVGVIGFSPVSTLLLQPLESRFPLPPKDMPAPAGIIVLGGAVDEDLTAARGVPTLLPSGARMIAGAALARRFPTARLIFTGGFASFSGHGLAEAPVARDIWLSLGVPASQITIEDRARNTWENGVFTRALLHPKPDETYLLVTSAWHMPRSMGIFRRLGYKVVAYPVDYRSFGDARDQHPPYRALDGMMNFDDAMHEWIGLVAYHLRGKTDAWFPAP